MKFFLVIILLAITIQVNCDGYGEPYPEPPAQKMKFNIGFNLPSMSISLPKLELPQISIKASVKQKKPFTLQLPVIKFNAHANTEEDEPSHPSGYASSEPESPSYDNYVGPPSNMGYERPSAGQYNPPMQYGPPEQDPSGYASSSHHAPATSPYNQPKQPEKPHQYQPQVVHEQPARPQVVHEQPMRQPQFEQPNLHHSTYQPQQQPQYQPSQKPQHHSQYLAQHQPQYRDVQKPRYEQQNPHRYQERILLVEAPQSSQQFVNSRSYNVPYYQASSIQEPAQSFQGTAINNYGYYVPKPSTQPQRFTYPYISDLL